MSDLTQKQITVLRKIKDADRRGENYSVDSSDSRRTLRSLKHRGLIEIVEKTVFSITSEGERVLKEEGSQASDKPLGEFS